MSPALICSSWLYQRVTPALSLIGWYSVQHSAENLLMSSHAAPFILNVFFYFLTETELFVILSHTHYLNSSCPLCCTMKLFCLHPLLEHTWVNCGSLDLHFLFGSNRLRNESKLNDNTQNEILRGKQGHWLWPEHLSNLDLYVMSFLLLFQAEQGKAFVLLCPIHLYLLKSFTVFSILSFYSQSLYLLVLRPKSSLICRIVLIWRGALYIRCSNLPLI